METQEIKLIREYYIKRCDTDLSKRSGVIAQEEKPYFKGSNITKKLIKQVNNGINCLSPECLLYVKRKLESSLQLEKEIHIEVKECNLINYVLKKKIKSGTGRGLFLAKNIAIFFLKNNPKKAKEMLNIFYEVQGIKNGSDWVKYVSNKGFNNFSCKELRGWVRSTQKSDIEELTCWMCKNDKTK